MKNSVPRRSTAAEAKGFYDVELLESLEPFGEYACLFGAVAHRAYREFSAASLANLLRSGGLVTDIKGMWRGLNSPDGLRRGQLWLFNPARRRFCNRV